MVALPESLSSWFPAAALSSCRARSLPRFGFYLVSGRGHERAPDLLRGHDLDRLELRCDEPLPLQVDGEDLGDVSEALFEAERSAVDVLV